MANPLEALTDAQLRIEIDRRDAMRFRRLVQAGIQNDVWFQRMAAMHFDTPKTLDEVREIVDYVIRAGNS